MLHCDLLEACFSRRAHATGDHAGAPNVFSPLYVMSEKVQHQRAISHNTEAEASRNAQRKPSLSLCSSYTLLKSAAVGAQTDWQVRNSVTQ